MVKLIVKNGTREKYISVLIKTKTREYLKKMSHFTVNPLFSSKQQPKC